MSATAPAQKTSWRTVAVLILIAACTSSLQLLLPYGSYRLAGPHPAGLIPDKNRQHGRDFWRERLRFDAMLRLELPSSSHLTDQFGSCAVTREELVLLLKPARYRHDSLNSREIVRVNLRTGRLTTSIAPPKIDHVVTDGEKLWFVPHRVGIRDPFIEAGRPIAIQRDSYADEDRQFPVIEFVDERWRPTDRFLVGAWLLPGFDSNPPRLFTEDHGGHRRLIYVDSPDVYIHEGLRFGTEEDVAAFGQRGLGLPERMTSDQLREMGVRKLKLDEQSERFFGCWMEDDLPRLIDIEYGDDKRSFGFSVRRLQPDGAPEIVEAPSSIRLTPDHHSEYSAHSERWCHVASSVDAGVFIISCDETDGRLHVLRWENQQFQVVATRGSRKVPWILLDATAFAAVAVAIPMLFLGICGWIVQRFRSQQLLAFGRDCAPAANVLRRGFARAIDLSVPAGLIIASVALHPDAIVWWTELVNMTRDLFDLIYDLPSEASWDRIAYMGQDLSSLLIHVFSAFVIWWLFLPAVLIAIGQIVWQARTGRTIGKWLLGIKVLRTTLRPCGIARSLLRELLLAVDSLCLLSWVPGVVSILLTCHSQRLGDLLADTIVIRDRAGKSNDPEALLRRRS